MWTRLVAGAAAHDINNLAQGLFNLLSLASAPGTTRESLERYASLARDGIKDLRKLGTSLRALAATDSGGERQRLDLLTVEAVTELDPPPERRIDLAPLDARAVVIAPPAALRLAIQSVVRYGLAASAPAGVVAVSVARDDAAAFVFVAAPTAPATRSVVEADLGALLGGPEREFGGDAGLVLAGAAAHLAGGRASAGPAPGGGLFFKLSFPRPEEDTKNEGSQDASVRELSNAIEFPLTLPSGSPIGADQLPSYVPGSRREVPAATAASRRTVNTEVSYSQARADTLREFERTYLEELMRVTEGNLSAAARRSGIDRSNLRRMLRQLGINYASTGGN
jgi:hypothetical protein